MRQRDRETGRQTQKDRETEIEGYKRQRETHREAGGDREIETETEAKTETKRVSKQLCYVISPSRFMTPDSCLDFPQ